MTQSPRRFLCTGLAAAGILSLAACAQPVQVARAGGPAPTSPDQGTGTTGGPTGTGIYFRAGPVARYQLDALDSVSMNMPDGSFQSTFTVKRARLTVLLEQAMDGLRAQVTLDSLSLDRPDDRLQPLVDSAMGTHWYGLISPDGHISELTPDRISVFGGQIRALLFRFLPVLPAGGAMANTTWSDTTSMQVPLLATASVTEDQVATYRAGRIENTPYGRGLRIGSEVDYDVSGAGTSFGQEVQVSGRGHATGTHILSPDGQLLYAQVRDSVDLNIALPAIGQTVPTLLTGSYSLTRIP